jgi:predicted metal-dependent HD superfamily phosphohydrolase
MLTLVDRIVNELKVLNVKWSVGHLDNVVSLIHDSYEGRPYHNIDHINNGLQTIETIADTLNPIDKARLTLAWIYHDIFYKAGSRKNERHSAILAEMHLKYLNVDDLSIRLIRDMIIATDYYDPIVQYMNPNFNLITDIDLIDIADREKFALNSMAVRHEFSHVSTEIYKTGRKKFFEKLLATRNNKIFLSKELDHLNEVAIRNLESYIHNLDRDYGDIFTIKEFNRHVNQGSFIDYDGSGYYGNDVESTHIPISCKDIASKKADIPRYCTHIHWFNK